MRGERLKELKENALNNDDNRNSLENETISIGSSSNYRLKERLNCFLFNQLYNLEKIQPTVKWRRQFESEINLPKSGFAYSYSSGEDSFSEDPSFETSEENYISYRRKKMRAFNPLSYRKEKWLYDTPGVILPEQV